MAMERMFSLRCDKCNNGPDVYYGWYSSDVRDKAKQDGWRIGNTDICPDCLAEENCCPICEGKER